MTNLIQYLYYYRYIKAIWANKFVLPLLKLHKLTNSQTPLLIVITKQLATNLLISQTNELRQLSKSTQLLIQDQSSTGSMKSQIQQWSKMITDDDNFLTQPQNDAQWNKSISIN